MPIHGSPANRFKQCFAACAILLGVAPGLSACAKLPSLDYYCHHRLWEKALVDAHAAATASNLEVASALFRQALAEAQFLGAQPVAFTLLELARVNEHRGRTGEAMEACTEARKWLESGNFGCSSEECEQQLATVICKIGELYEADQKLDLARTAISQSLSIYERLWQHKKSRLLGQQFSTALFIEARLLNRANKERLSKQISKRASIIYTWSGGLDDRYHSQCEGQQPLSDERAISTQLRQQFEPSNTEVLDFWFQFTSNGDGWAQAGKLEQAEQQYLLGLSAAESTLDDSGVIECFNKLRKVAEKMHNRQRLTSYLFKEIDWLGKNYGSKHPTLIEPLFKLGELKACPESNWSEEAIPILTRAAAIAEEKGDVNARLTAFHAMQLATTCSSVHKNYQVAEQCAERAYRIGKQMYSAENAWASVLPLVSLTEVYATSKQPAKERATLAQIDKILEHIQWQRHMQLACWLCDLASTCISSDRENSAKGDIARAAGIVNNKDNWSANSPELQYAARATKRLKEVEQELAARDTIAGTNEARSLIRLGKLEEATLQLLPLIKNAKALPPATVLPVATASYLLSCELQGKGKHEEAERQLSDTLELCTQAGPVADWIAAYCWETLGGFHLRKGQKMKAARSLLKAIALRKEIISRAHESGMSKQGIREHEEILAKDTNLMRSLSGN